MTKPIPDGFHTITPHIIVSDGAKAIEFYKKAFGAQEIERFMTPDGKGVMHAQLKIGDSRLMVGSEFPPTCLSPKSRGGTTVSLYLYVENADTQFDRAVKAGCTVKMPMTDQFWGDRYGQVEDPFGHQWSIATHKQDLTQEQIAANARAFFANMGKKSPELATA
ncbi:MAG TPA: VOC family protein [Candidatus Limnocylindrales bacterium]|nr:VOC family protein [Candidatus Limnocylindrales bacterium]